MHTHDPVVMDADISTRDTWLSSFAHAHAFEGRSVHHVVHQLESLEPRLLMSGTLDSHPALSPVVSADWFIDVAPSSYAGSSGGSATFDADDRVQTIEWEGERVDVVTQQWLVQLTEQAIQQAGSAANVQTLLDLGSIGGQVIQGLGMEGLILIETDAHVDQSQFVTALKASDLVAAIEPNVVIQAELSPNDSNYGSLWGMQNINAPQAWNTTTGSSNVVVAVIDTGVDFNHPDLRANMWVNSREDNDGVDDDGNGFVDDIYGYDFVNNRGTPMDDNGHGTHVAGTIGAVGNNGTGVAGVSWNVSIMALKFLNANGSGFISNAVRALNYATMMKKQYGVNVVVANNSWGGGSYNSQMLNAIRASQQANILFVAAAGNERNDNDARPSYPANYDVNNVISVAAIDSGNRLASFSNWGANTVHIAAPGVGIRSTVPGGGYANYSGTSMAAPHVSGVAALLWARNPNMSYQQVKAAILNSADAVGSLAGKVSTGGKLDAAGALAGSGGSGGGGSGGGGSTRPVPTTPDRYESNNTARDVNRTATGVNSPNLGWLLEDVRIDDLNTYDGSDDWFRFEMNDRGDSSNYVRINLDHSDGDLDLAVYRGIDGSLLGTNTGARDSHTVSLAGEEAGVYFIHVWGNNNARNEYSLTIKPAAELNDAYESNNSRSAVNNRTEGEADSPNLGAVAGNHVIRGLNTLDGSEDWFRFQTINVGGAANRVQLNFNHALGDLDLVVYNESGAVVGRSESVSSGETVSLAGLARGVYYARVTGYNDARSPDYTLSIAAPTPPKDRAGNQPRRGMVVKNVLAADRIVSEYVGAGDPVDYYRVALNRPGELTLDLKAGSGSASVQLVNARGAALTESVRNDVGVMTVQLARGTYYVMVEADASEQVDYELSFAATPLAGKAPQKKKPAKAPAKKPAKHPSRDADEDSGDRSRDRAGRRLFEGDPNLDQQRAMLAATQAMVQQRRMTLLNVRGQALRIDAPAATNVLNHDAEADDRDNVLVA